MDDAHLRMPLRGGVTMAHYFLRERLRPGDQVVDATCGNGRDTLVLARLVGDGGRVYALDADSRAIEATARLLRQEGVDGRVTLLERGHEDLGELITVPIMAAVFNLGYLPGVEGGQPTGPATTREALDAALKLLAPEGLVLVCIYTGHEGGEAEAEAVEAWGEGLPPREYNVWRCRQLNRSSAAPYLLIVEKNPASGSR